MAASVRRRRRRGGARLRVQLLLLRRPVAVALPVVEQLPGAARQRLIFTVRLLQLVLELVAHVGQGDVADERLCNNQNKLCLPFSAAGRLIACNERRWFRERHARITASFVFFFVLFTERLPTGLELPK